jgi:hypothetical protein
MNEQRILKRLAQARRGLCIALWCAVLLPLPAALISPSVAFMTSGIVLAVAALLWWYRAHLFSSLIDHD